MNCSRVLKSFIQPRYKNIERFINSSSRNKEKCELFSLEKKRQREAIGRIEKIEVNYQGTPEPQTLVMNNHISTPFNCAQHLGQMLMDRSVLAVVNGIPWDMHRPFTESCTLDFLHFHVKEPHIVNKTFWRTCCFILGAVATKAFKDVVNVQLHSFPSPKVRSGSFVYDIDLGVEDWKPTEDELRVLSAEMTKFCNTNYKIERLVVTSDLAAAIFADDKHKSLQIPDIAEQNNGKITLYKVGDHIDISVGPMMGYTNFVGKCTVASVHKISGLKTMYRFQGVALPKTIHLNHFAFGILENRAKKMNEARLPVQNKSIDEDSHNLAATA